MILGGLKSIGLKIFPIICKIKREGIQTLSFFFGKGNADRRYQAAVQSSGKKSAQRLLRSCLTCDCIYHQFPHLFHGCIIAVFMRTAFQPPPFHLPASIRRSNHHSCRLQFKNPFQHTISRRPCRTNTENLVKALPIHLWPNSRAGKKSFQPGSKIQPVFPEGIKQRLYSNPIPIQKNHFFVKIHNSHGKYPIQLFYKFRAIMEIHPPRQLRISICFQIFSQFLQLSTQFPGIIKFPVQKNCCSPFQTPPFPEAFVCFRLFPGR